MVRLFHFVFIAT